MPSRDLILLEQKTGKIEEHCLTGHAGLRGTDWPCRTEGHCLTGHAGLRGTA